MAPTLTSKSFLLRPPTTRHVSTVAVRHSRSAVFAKKGGAGKTTEADDGFSKAAAAAGAAFNSFKFDLSKVPDIQSLVPAVRSNGSSLSFGNTRRKDATTVFVAGATGQAGVRIAQKLLRDGFVVRAGVPDLAAAQELARLAATYQFISKEELKRLNAVECGTDDAKSIAKAIGNASKVVVTVGPAEYNAATEITTSDALLVVQAAKLAEASHVAIVYDGSSGPTSTYNVLDGISSFFNNLFSKTQPLSLDEFLQKIAEVDISYTLIKTSLTEDYAPESSYRLVVAAEGSRGGENDYKVAKYRIADLVADVFSNTAVAENKVVEVYTDPSAPSKSADELFSAIPEDGRRKAYAESLAKQKAAEEALLAAEKAQEAEEAAKELEQEVKKLSEKEATAATLAQEARQKAAAAGVSVENIFNKANDFRSGLSFEKLGSQFRSAVRLPPSSDDDELPNKVQIATVRGQAKARSLQPNKAVVKPSPFPKGLSFKQKKKEVDEPKARQKIKPAPAAGDKEEPKKEIRKVFGGLFQQETIYVDED